MNNTKECIENLKKLIFDINSIKPRCNAELSNYLGLRFDGMSRPDYITYSFINLDYDNYDESLKELQERENMNNVDINVSTIFEKYRLKNAEKKLMFTSNHPKTLLFLEILNEIFLLLNIESLSLEMENCIDYKNNENYVGLP